MKLVIASDSNNGTIKSISLVDTDGTTVKEAIDGNSIANIMSGNYPLDWTVANFTFKEPAITIFNILKPKLGLKEI